MSSEMPQFQEGKNSPLRLYTAKRMRRTALAFHKKYPKIKPNHVSVFGAASVLVGGALIEGQNRRGNRSKSVIALGTGLQAVGYFCDGLDGALDRAINEVTPGATKGSHGSVVDLVMDKTEEVGLSVMRSKTAKTRGRPLGKLAADAVSLTTIVPSEIREARNEKGIVIDEVGNFVTFFGSRPGRVVFNSISALFPKLQPVSDGLGTAANLYAAQHRFRVIDNKAGKGFTDEEKLTARRRKQAMHAMEGIALARALYSLRKNKA